jgi:hypothetical protein
MDDTKELILELMENAKAGEHTKFEQLRCFSEYIAGRIIYRSLKKVVEDLKYSADNLFKLYCSDIKQQQANVNLLLAYKQLQLTVNFYKEESRIIKAILRDYEKYMWEGDFLADLFLGRERDI